jgi:L-aspartate oxidase
VARAIAQRETAFLDARPIGAERVRERFPNITAAVAEHGFDLTSEPVPIAPAAHYFLGGVQSDVNGRTTLSGLFAAGECAATGVHGANRMAGNSLAEAVVFGRRAADAMSADALDQPPAAPDVEKDESAVRLIHPTHMEDLRDAMSRGAGLVRTDAALAETETVVTEIARNAVGPAHAAAVAADLICRSARLRDESRGVHYRADHPVPRSEWEARHVTLRSE